MKSSSPLVSIMAVNYNSRNYVIETLESIKNQTYENVELIIIDDCSTDGSVDIIREWVKTYPKPVKLILHEKNRGLCATCNHALENATGKYTSMIATDDIMLPDKITKQVAILELTGENIALVYSDAYLIDDAGKRKFGTYMTVRSKCKFEYPPSGNILQHFAHNNFLMGQSALYKKSVFDAVGGYDEELAFEDYDMSIRIAKRYEILHSDEIFVCYRVHSESFSSKTSNWDQMLFPLYLKHFDVTGFKEKAEMVLTNCYIYRDKDFKNKLEKFNRAAGTKYKYSRFIRAGVPPILFKIFIRGAEYFHFIGK
ncbi:MAG: glycosyltransferase [Bacteroidota bacterium]